MPKEGDCGILSEKNLLFPQVEKFFGGKSEKTDFSLNIYNKCGEKPLTGRENPSKI